VPAPPNTRVVVTGDAALHVQPLQRLTRAQYEYTVSDLLGQNLELREQLPHDARGDSGFSQPGPVGALEVRAYMDAAQRLARLAVDDGGASLGCDLTQPDALSANGGAEQDCVQIVVSQFAKRAYRRPLTAEEETSLRSLYDTLRTEHGYSSVDALQVLLRAILQSPNFLYRWELGPQPAVVESDGSVRLTAYELASRLSYFLRESLPDEALFARAEAGTLSQPQELQAEARRLLAEPKAMRALLGFHEQWLETEQLESLAKDPSVYPDFERLKVSMRQEVAAFIEHAFFASEPKLQTLFGASFTFANASLAELYGVELTETAEVNDGSMAPLLSRVELPVGERFGLLTQAAFLSQHAYPYDSSPIRRGRMVREKLLCQVVPPPPPNLVINPPEPDPEVSLREQLNQHSSDPACSGCHQLIDPLGFAFENYDGIGRYRTTTSAGAVDSRGELTGLAGGTKSFNGAQDLTRLLFESDEFKHCVVRQWLRYGLRRSDGVFDGPALTEAYSAFEASDFDVRELLVALVQTRSFTTRAPALGETLQ
jgi:hypothetical protein